MKARVLLILIVGVSFLAGCGTSAYSVKIPFSESPEAVFLDAPHVTIEDTREEDDRTTHLSASIFTCQRWYGDDTYQPPKLVYLDKLIAERVPAGTPVSIRLDKFDTVEYCDNTANRAVPSYSPPPVIPGGDSVRVHLTGQINGVPFDVKRAFDYDGLPYKFTEMPSANSTYRELLHKMMGDVADAIVAKLPAAGAP